MDTEPQKKLNPFAFPSETNMRFILFLLSAIAMIFWFAEELRVELVGVDYLKDPFSVLENYAYPEIDTYLTMADIRKVSEVALIRAWELFLVLLLPIVTILGALILATIIYQSYPSRIRKKKKLVPLMYNQDSLLTRNIEVLSDLANICPPPRIEIEPGSRTDGQAFGTHKCYSLRLGGRMRLQLRKAPDKFRAIILHELAHIVNGDIERTYFTQSLWVTILILSVFVVGSTVYRIGLMFFLNIFIFFVGESSLEWDQWIKLAIGCIQTIFQFGFILILVVVTRSSILRIREIYADWRAALWGSKESLSSSLARQPNEKVALWKRLFLLHPTPQERLVMLQDPIRLFHIQLDIPILVSILLALLTSGLYLFLGWINALVRQMRILIVSLGLFALRSYSSEGLVQWLIVIITFIIVAFVYIVQGIFLLLGPYLMVKTVGLQIQRATFAGMIAKSKNFISYRRMALLALLIAISFQVGLIISPSRIFAPIHTYMFNKFELWMILRDIFLMLFWIFATTGLTWSWMIYFHFFSMRLLGTHTGTSLPRFTRACLNLASSILLLVLYTPVVIGQVQMSLLMAGTFELTSLITLIFALMAAFILYPIIFGLTLLLVKFYKRWIVRPRCPSCGQVTSFSIAIGQTCAFCGNDLAPWAFVVSHSTQVS